MKNENSNISDAFSTQSGGVWEVSKSEIVERDSDPGEITCLLDDLSNDEAAEALWRYFFPKLVDYAAFKMREMPSKAQDEEDIALSAMHSFFAAVESGLYDLKNRDQLWRLLVTITFRKISRERRRQYAQKRGGGVIHIGNNHGGNDGADPISRIADSRARCPSLSRTFTDSAANCWRLCQTTHCVSPPR